MTLSPDDARLLFHRWRDHSSQVRIKLLSPVLIFDATGVVTHSAPDALGVSGPSWQLTVPLADADFSFSDPREIPVASVRDAESAQYEFGVALRLASGDRLTLLELKTPEAQS